VNDSKYPFLDSRAVELVDQLAPILDGEPTSVVMPVLGIAFLMIAIRMTDPIRMIDELTQFMREEIRQLGIEGEFTVPTTRLH